MAEQDSHVPSALRVALLHLPHLRDPEGVRVPLRVVDAVPERLRAQISRLASDPAVRGQVLRQASLPRLRLERKWQR